MVIKVKASTRRSKKEVDREDAARYHMRGGMAYVALKAKIGKVLHEFKAGSLHSGSKKGPVVTNPKQAVAISLNEARRRGANIPEAK